VEDKTDISERSIELQDTSAELRIRSEDLIGRANAALALAAEACKKLQELHRTLATVQ
jgi:hypothetical protein